MAAGREAESRAHDEEWRKGLRLPLVLCVSPASMNILMLLSGCHLLRAAFRASRFTVPARTPLLLRVQALYSLGHYCLI